MKEFDVAVIGAGPAGYVAAIRCAQLDLKTVCIDSWTGSDGKPALGGTCLNVGCIPSKALLDSSHHFHNLSHVLPSHGIKVDSAAIDIGVMQARKDKVVATLTRGIAGLLRKNKVTAMHGKAAFVSASELSITDAEGAELDRVRANHIVVASGSLPVAIGAAPVDGEYIVDNAGALAFSEVPARLGVIGAGVIGLELGSVWSRLGSQVVLLEAMEEFLATADRQVAAQAARSFRKQGLDVHLGAMVTAAQVDGEAVTVNYTDGSGTHSVEFDRLIVAVGRKANAAHLNLEAAGLALDERGRIPVDDHCRTAIQGIYAVGDAVTGPMLAHKASEEGIAVAEQIAGQSAHIDHGIVPWIIYTHPEIAWVGKTEGQLEAEGVAFRSGSFPYAALGRAQGAGETEGFVKILADARTDTILGVHIFGNQASELVAEAVTAMSFQASSEDLARTIHGHPTLSEALHEAALAVDDRAIHI